MISGHLETMNLRTLLFLDLAVAVSVYVSHLSHHLINHYAAY